MRNRVSRGPVRPAARPCVCGRDRVRGPFHLIVDPDGAAGRVHYDGWRDRLSIDSPHGSLEIRFRWRHTTFPWRGRVYRVGSTLGSRVRVFEGDQRVLEGKETWSGIRFDVISPEFRDIARELAVGFGLRTQAFATAIILAAGAH
ncbi:MAG: hypothetical protein E6K11_00490 [Methanobacteriota archaeon]|nr:MAG: hypothetical protein E6K11_00490 [Euryarchaeota archaeon]